ncbi:TPA: hypothetical protein N0F65_008673 [Lagenidium giganteum]|uniref:Serine/threonine-protein phosphatase n=1 Tax=Lagenidium giganteum TaxID=4803 RepID=A0AAV2ZAQ4_9STRA|nr:TPA: hypothetical protein N0F65_008673 [Lagenidium giganteum]
MASSVDVHQSLLATLDYDRIPSPERWKADAPTKCTHQYCCESQKQHVNEIQTLRDTLAVLKAEKEKEIMQLKELLAAKTAAAVVAASPKRRGSHVVVPAVYSILEKGVVRTARLERQVSMKSQRALAALPRDVPNRVADRVAAAFADPMVSLPYFHSIQFGADLVELSAQVCAIFEAEERCLALCSPLYVFGDIHGNFTDLKFFTENMWSLGMNLTAGSFLFLGDYVDRGTSSLECVAYLFAQKILYPKKMFMLRGNHETRAVNGLEEHYGPGCFLTQCKKRFGNEEGYIVWHQINHAFDRLPLAATIDNEVFCVHGGIPRPLQGERQLESIRKIPSTALLDVLDKKYYEENTVIGMVSDMLWADPAPEDKESQLDANGFGRSVRGGNAISFGDHAIDDFLSKHKFSHILRAHEAVTEGVGICKSARILTIFSTSKDHGLGDEAKCGCVLVEKDKILVINRSPRYGRSQLLRRRSTSTHYQGPGVPGTATTTSRRSRGGIATNSQAVHMDSFQALEQRLALTELENKQEEQSADENSDSTDDEVDQDCGRPPRGRATAASAATGPTIVPRHSRPPVLSTTTSSQSQQDNNNQMDES